MQAKIIRNKISKEELAQILKENYETMVKVDVDIKRGILSAGGEWHSEGQKLLVEDGSSGADVWGCNFYPGQRPSLRVQYNSLINVKPALGHKSMDVRIQEVKDKMRDIIQKLLLSDDETL